MEKTHVYLRDTKGRIVTHFLVDSAEWNQYEAFARLKGLTMSQFLHKAIMEYPINDRLPEAKTESSGTLLGEKV